MICVECGKESKIINNGLCLNCYITSNKFTKGPNLFNIIKCTNCNLYKFKNKWFNESLNQIINKTILQNFKISDEFNKPEIKIHFIDDTNQYKKLIEVKIIGSILNSKIIEKHEIQINIKRETCDTCSKQFGGYHEAIIQIRADKRNPTHEEIEGIYTFVLDYIKNLQSKGNNNIFIADFEKKEDGITFFLSDDSISLSIIKRIQEIYAGDIKRSSKNIGMKDGKQIYRMTYLLRLYSFIEGEILSKKEKYFYIKKISKNKIHLVDLVNWNENIFDVKELNNFVIKGGNEFVKNMIFVSQTNDEVQVMDQKNYNIYIIKKPKKIPFDSDIVKIIQIQDEIFLFPIL